MSNNNGSLTESNTSTSSASTQDTECQLTIHPNITSGGQHNQLEVQLFENLQLAYLITQFEAVLNKVKQLELNYLLQPTQVATYKLKELKKITEELACDHYNNHPCANESCCNEPVCLEVVDDNKKKIICNDQVDETSKNCEKSCRCSSNEGELDQNRKMITGFETFDIHPEKENCRGIKCNPCKCSVDATGKKVKTLECRLASKARKYKRNEAELFELGNIQLQQIDEKLPLRSKRSPTNILTERTVSNSKLEIQANLTNFQLNVKKENTAIQDITYQNARERNQAIYCNLSSESSSEEYYSDSSSDEISFLNDIALPRACVNSRRPIVGSNNKKKCSPVECCGCGQRVESIEVGESETCPCGCGDVTTLPEGKYVDRSPIVCDNCGVALTERSSVVSDVSKISDSIKMRRQGFCLIPTSDAVVVENKSFGTEPIFTDLGEYVIPIPTYST